MAGIFSWASRAAHHATHTAPAQKARPAPTAADLSSDDDMGSAASGNSTPRTRSPAAGYSNSRHTPPRQGVRYRSRSSPRGSSGGGSPRQPMPLARKAVRTAGRMANTVAASAAHAGTAQAAGLWRRVLMPVVTWLFNLLRTITSVQASITGMLALCALLVALAGFAGLVTVGLTRHYTYVQAHIIRPLDFDYSTPVATATASLQPPPPRPPFRELLAQALGYTKAVADKGSSAAASAVYGGGAAYPHAAGYGAPWGAPQQHPSSQSPYPHAPQSPYPHAPQPQYPYPVPPQQQPQQHPAPTQQQQHHQYAYPQQQGQAHPPSPGQPGYAGAPHTHPASPTPPPASAAGGSFWGAATHPTTPTAAAAKSTPRTLPPGQAISVMVTLHLPDSHTDLFQVTGELLSADGHVLAKSSRTHMHRHKPLLWRTLRKTWLFPLYASGWLSDTQEVKLQLFHRYVEQAGQPLAYFKAYLSSRNTTAAVLPPPAVYSASVDVKIKLGLWRTLMHWLSPSWTLCFMLASISGAAAVGGSIATIALTGLALLLHRIGSGGDSSRRSRAEREALERYQQVARLVAAQRGDAGGIAHGAYTLEYDAPVGESEEEDEGVSGIAEESDAGSENGAAPRHGISGLSDGGEEGEVYMQHAGSEDHMEPVPEGGRDAEIDDAVSAAGSPQELLQGRGAGSFVTARGTEGGAEPTNVAAVGAGRGETNNGAALEPEGESSFWGDASAAEPLSPASDQQQLQQQQQHANMEGSTMYAVAPGHDQGAVIDNQPQMDVNRRDSRGGALPVQREPSAQKVAARGLFAALQDEVHGKKDQSGNNNSTAHAAAPASAEHGGDDVVSYDNADTDVRSGDSGVGDKLAYRRRGYAAPV